MDGRVDSVQLAICGGGLAGATLACMLAGQPLRIAVLEATAPGARRHTRALALSWSSRRILEASALWPALQPHVTPVRAVHVAIPGRFGALRCTAADLGTEALGYVVPEDRLLQLLWSRLGTATNITVFRPAELCQLEIGPRHITLQMRQKQQAERPLRAQLLAAADGVRSRVCALAQIDHRSTDYGQTALVMNGLLDRDLQGMACERLTPVGPLAMLPLGGARCKLVYSVATACAAELLALSAAVRMRRVQAVLGHRFGRLLELEEPGSWPLRSRVALGGAPRVVLLGDAACAVHPVAAQGFNRCMQELAGLAAGLRAPQQNTGQDADIGAPAGLQDFAARCQGERQRVLRMTDRLARLLAAPGNPVAAAVLPLLQGMVLTALDVLPGMRQQWLRRASGLHGGLPAWVRGA